MSVFQDILGPGLFMFTLFGAPIIFIIFQFITLRQVKKMNKTLISINENLEHEINEKTDIKINEHTITER
jgi:hypothetical protein